MTKDDSSFMTGYHQLLQSARTTPDSLAKRVQQLESESAIRETLAAYAVYYDTPDLDSLLTIFTADATVHDVVGVFHGRGEIREHFEDLVRNFKRAVHFALNTTIRFDGADRARAASLLYAITVRDDGRARVTAGTYTDLLQRDAIGVWRIAERRSTADIAADLSEPGTQRAGKGPCP